MLNKLWAAMLGVAVAAGGVQVGIQGPEVLNTMGQGLFASAKAGADLALGLVAALVLWLGVYRVAEAAGVVPALARFLSPLLHRLMPGVPPNHPAMASIGMNVSMGMLGIDDGALPSGLKAMSDLEQLNPHPGQATPAQQMFLVYMTTSVTLLPTSIWAYRAQAGAVAPADVFLPLLLSGYTGLFVGLLYMAVRQKIRLADPVLLKMLFGFAALVAGLVWLTLQVAQARLSAWGVLVGNAVLVAAVVGLVLWGVWRKVAVFDEFLDGASRGFEMAVQLIPYLVGMLVAVGLLRNSGAFGLLQQALTQLTAWAGWQAPWVEAIPHALMKPFSGGAARAMMLDTFSTHGPDSFRGHLASVVQGAHDTTFYVLAVCAGAAKLKHLGPVLSGALLANGAAFAMAVWSSMVFWG